jgi:putative DNA primase/helicase
MSIKIIKSNSKKVIAQFKSAMQSEGITPPDEIIAEGKIHRFPIKDKSLDTNTNGAYRLTLGKTPCGFFQDWAKHDKPILWNMSGDKTPLTDEQLKAIEQQRIEHQKETAQLHSEAASKAKDIWQHAIPAINHPYLAKKKIQPHNSKIGKDNMLILPLYNTNNELINLQFITDEGEKRFLKGGQKKACFWEIGELVNERVLIAEGFATAASIHEDTGCLTVIAFDAGNLLPVAKVMRQRYPQAEIIIMADNDESGVGQTKAKAAALAIKGLLLVCPVVGDFNDYVTQGV